MTVSLPMSEVPVSLLSETLSWSNGSCHLAASQDGQERDKADLQAVSRRTWTLKFFTGCSDFLSRHLQPAARFFPNHRGDRAPWRRCSRFCTNISNFPGSNIRASILGDSMGPNARGGSSLNLTKARLAATRKAAGKGYHPKASHTSSFACVVVCLFV